MTKYVQFEATLILEDGVDPEPLLDKLFDVADDLCGCKDGGDCTTLAAGGRTYTREQFDQKMDREEAMWAKIEEDPDFLDEIIEDLRRRERQWEAEQKDDRPKRRNRPEE